jgi:peptidoglycan/LPS O-acetylase OafA/YrhL
VSSASPASVTLGAERRTNNFDALRLLAAFAVVVGHAAVLRGAPEQAPAFLGIHVHVLGVAVFFVISGWLITGSWERSRSVPQFVVSRALRILPLLWVVVLLSVTVLGPLMTDLPLGEYARSTETWRYLRNLVMLPADGLPGVFTDVPYPGVVNGSVWTLRAEVICYALVLGAGLLAVALRGRWQTAALVAFGAGSVVLVEHGDVRLLGSSLTAAAGTWIYFAVAALLRLHLPRRALRGDVAVGALALWGLASLAGEAWAVRASWLALSYVVLVVGLRGWPVARDAARFGDLSYGLYLFAFPVQQVVLDLAPAHPAWVDVDVVTGASLALAYCSWHLVERPALDLRTRLPWFARPRVPSQPAA